MDYSIKNLRQVEDSAPKHGFSEVGEARFPRSELRAENTGLAYHVLRPNKRQAFAHKHDEAEEIYVVLSGSGRIKLDDDVVELATMDAVRIAPSTVRALEAGDDGLELLAFGPRHEADGEIMPIDGFWAE
ncbi:MAG TPA: cupin domain-containing protein [Thermoleophilaceae bacterium]|nr:cupin domain-containing protein [Thermoleophilaceae bacterium]